MTGKVYLVGAGPGDPNLLTVKAAGLLRSADVVLHDALVSPEILALVSERAQVRNVGKRCGEKNISQEEINFLMVEFASLGMMVVRLKSGDPGVFGRLGEEIAALRSAGMDFEIVPGVTSAFGAAASIQTSLTRRHTASAVILLTGQQAFGSDGTDWRKFVSSGATLVIYMPGHDYAGLAARLVAAGSTPETPCAVVSRATAPDQRTHFTSLAALPQSPRLPSPTLLIVGDVVKFPRDSESLSPDIGAIFEEAAQIPVQGEEVA